MTELSCFSVWLRGEMDMQQAYARGRKETGNTFFYIKLRKELRPFGRPKRTWINNSASVLNVEWDKLAQDLV